MAPLVGTEVSEADELGAELLALLEVEVEEEVAVDEADELLGLAVVVMVVIVDRVLLLLLVLASAVVLTALVVASVVDSALEVAEVAEVDSAVEVAEVGAAVVVAPLPVAPSTVK